MTNPNPGRIVAIVAAVGVGLTAVLGLLPGAWAAWLRRSRKAVVALAGGVVSITASPALFPPSVAPWVALAGVVATAVVTYWTPNERG